MLGPETKQISDLQKMQRELLMLRSLLLNSHSPSPFEDDDRSNIQYGDDGLDMDNESLQLIYCGHAEEYERHGQPEFHGTSYMIGSVSSPDAVSSPSTPTARQKAFLTRMHVRDQKHTVSHFTLVTYIQLHFTL
jgi:hypothetical protein